MHGLRPGRGVIHPVSDETFAQQERLAQVLACVGCLQGAQLLRALEPRLRIDERHPPTNAAIWVRVALERLFEAGFVANTTQGRHGS